MDREQIMGWVRNEIREHGNSTVGAGQREKILSTAINFAFEPSNGKEMYLLQRGLTAEDLTELRLLGGSESKKMANSMGGRNRKREESQRLAAMKDRIRDAAIND